MSRTKKEKQLLKYEKITQVTQEEYEEPIALGCDTQDAYYKRICEYCRPVVCNTHALAFANIHNFATNTYACIECANRLKWIDLNDHRFSTIKAVVESYEVRKK